MRLGTYASAADARGRVQSVLSDQRPAFLLPAGNAVEVWAGVASEQEGQRVALECGDYFDPPDGLIDEWLFGAAPAEVKRGLPPFRVPRFFRTLSGWLNLLLDTGFVLERFDEPRASEEAARRCPRVAGTRLVAHFLLVRCRKPAR